MVVISSNGDICKNGIPARGMRFGSQTTWFSPIQQILGVVVLALSAAWSNPGQDEVCFRQFLRARRTLPITLRFEEAIGVTNIRVRNFLLGAIGYEEERVFLGAFDSWIELPASLVAYSATGFDSIRVVDHLPIVFVAFFLLWQVFPRIMSYNAVASWMNFRAGRIWTLVYAQCSHAQFDHLLGNLMLYYSIAPEICVHVQPFEFWLLFMTGGAAGILTSLVLSPLLFQTYVECLGASGSIFAMMGYLAKESGSTLWWCGRQWAWSEFVIIQAMISLFVGRKQTWSGSCIDVVSHLGGATAGWAMATYGFTWFHVNFS